MTLAETCRDVLRWGNHAPGQDLDVSLCEIVRALVIVLQMTSVPPTLPRVLLLAEIDLHGATGMTHRYLQLAQEMSARYDVSIGTLSAGATADVWNGIPCVPVPPFSRVEFLRQFDLVVWNFSPSLQLMLDVSRTGRRLLVDAYNLYQFEHEFICQRFPTLRNRTLNFLYRQLFRLGISGARAYLVSAAAPAEYLRRKNPDARILVHPIRMPDESTTDTEVVESLAPVLRGRLPLISNGGLWPWFDYETLFEAVKIARRTRPEIVLVFPAWRSVYHAEFGQSLMQRIRDDAELSPGVIANEEWLSLPQRRWVLQQGLAGVCCHFAGDETRYSYRTRVSDCLRNRLPVLTTEGDYFSGVIRAHGCGRVHGYGDAKALARDILELVADPGLRLQMQSACGQAMPAAALTDGAEWRQFLKDVPVFSPGMRLRMEAAFWLKALHHWSRMAGGEFVGAITSHARLHSPPTAEERDG